MFDICCIGHISSDKIVTTRSLMHMPGGTALYFSCALSKLDVKYLLVTALGQPELHYVADLRKKGIDIRVQPSTYTVYFENIYAEDQDQRTQRVLQQADPFTLDELQSVEAHIFHIGALLANDISIELIKTLAAKGKVSLDVQGYLRKVVDHKVYAVDWPEKEQALQYVDVVKADVAELQALTGLSNAQNGAKMLAGWGAKEIVITNGSKGSFIYSEGIFYTIPARIPSVIVDATGCGDTYMAGYLFRRSKGFDIQSSGEFAAAMASIKMETPGPFEGTEDNVLITLLNE